MPIVHPHPHHHILRLPLIYFIPKSVLLAAQNQNTNQYLQGFGHRGSKTLLKDQNGSKNRDPQETGLGAHFKR